jgi:hypothetical protein
MSEAEAEEHIENEPSQSQRTGGWKPLVWILIVFGLLLAGWFNYPTLLQMIAPNPTPTVQPTVTQTQRPTRTPSPSPSPTIEPSPTITPVPASAYYLPEGGQLQPPIRGVEGGVIVLDEATSATVEPGFDTPFWVSSDQIASESGFDILDPYYATYGYGAITWETDVFLAPGMVEVFVMDTLYSSAGPLDFQVHLGDSQLFPIIGSQQVDFLSVRGEPPQRTNQWRSLGIYELDRLEKLSVSTAWERRDERTLVAVDRVAIVPLPASTRQLLSAFPRDRDLVIIDNLAADIESAQVLYQEEEELAWGDQYQYVINPTKDVRVVWNAPEYLSPGQYQVVVWVPAAHAGLEVTYTLRVNGNDFANDAGETAISINQAEYSNGQWVDLGIWTTPLIYEKPVQLSLQLEIKSGLAGEAAFDAIAIVKWGQPQETP